MTSRDILDYSKTWDQWFKMEKAFNGFSNDDIAKKLDLTPSTIRKWSLGRSVYKHNIAALCWAFGCSELTEDVYEKFCTHEIVSRGRHGFRTVNSVN